MIFHIDYMEDNEYVRKLLTYETLHSKYLNIPASICEKLQLKSNQIMKLELTSNNQILVTKINI